MKLINNIELLGKYVLYTDNFKYNNILIVPKSHIFLVFDKDSDPDTRYCWCIKSLRFKKLELWVKQTQLVVLESADQESIKLLYE